MRNLRNIICLLFIAINAIAFVVMPLTYLSSTVPNVEININTLVNFFEQQTEVDRREFASPQQIAEMRTNSYRIMYATAAGLAFLTGLNLALSALLYLLSKKITHQTATKRDFRYILFVVVALLMAWAGTIVLFFFAGNVNAFGKEGLIAPLLGMNFLYEPAVMIVSLVLSLWLLLALADQNKNLLEDSKLII